MLPYDNKSELQVVIDTARGEHARADRGVARELAGTVRDAARGD